MNRLSQLLPLCLVVLVRKLGGPLQVFDSRFPRCSMSGPHPFGPPPISFLRLRMFPFVTTARVFL